MARTDQEDVLYPGAPVSGGGGALTRTANERASLISQRPVHYTPPAPVYTQGGATGIAQPMPYAQGFQRDLATLGQLIDETRNSQAPKQDLGAATELARQEAALRGLTGGLGARVVTRAQGGVLDAFARERMGRLAQLLQIRGQLGLAGNAQEAQQRQYLMELARAAAAGDQQAHSQFWSNAGGVLGGLAGGVIGTFALPGLGTAAGATLGYNLGSAAGGFAGNATYTPKTLGDYSG